MLKLNSAVRRIRVSPVLDAHNDVSRHRPSPKQPPHPSTRGPKPTRAVNTQGSRAKYAIVKRRPYAARVLYTVASTDPAAPLRAEDPRPPPTSAPVIQTPGGDKHGGVLLPLVPPDISHGVVRTNVWHHLRHLRAAKLVSSSPIILVEHRQFCATHKTPEYVQARAHAPRTSVRIVTNTERTEHIYKRLFKNLRAPRVESRTPDDSHATTPFQQTGLVTRSQ